MIHGYSDHAANERTFLAWVRTGIGFGLVVEKFNFVCAGDGERGGHGRRTSPDGRTALGSGLAGTTD